ncbi:MAG: M3 family metallopeptidase, partial [Zetaproteobacteria bacterium]|nr:M3 family metallopeptidase [Zetaproteobacteria bacterium]
MRNNLPDFDHLHIEDILTNLDACIAESHVQIDAVTTIATPNWQNTIHPLEQLDDNLQQLWGTVTHLNAVRDSEALRQVYQQGVQRVTAWHSEVAQNEALYASIKSLRASNAYLQCNAHQQKVIDNMLRDFRLAGADLVGEARERFKTIQLQLSELGTEFEQHVLDATRVFTLLITQEEELAGIPDSIRAAAAQRAKQSDQQGWLFTLDIPSYLPFMQYAENQNLRETMYRAFTTRATSGETDNSPVIDQLLTLRHEAATILGFENYADYSLATKMAESPAAAKKFLRELAVKSKPMAKQEMDELRTFAKENLNIHTLQAWDIPFVSERLKRHSYNLSQEDLKPYFPETHVLKGLFQLAQALYNIEIVRAEASVWHENVSFYRVNDANGVKIAGFYLDPYARPHKRGGAWMDECTVRWQKTSDTLQLPVAYLVCNFEAPIGDQPALWTHDEVLTLFHEFGHGLHHMLTTIDVRSISGINGVPWDAVELPSQFMENFCWERQAIDMFAKHVESGEPLPDELFTRMIAAKNFQSGMQMLRQIEFSLFDLELHSAKKPDVQSVLDAVRHEIAVFIPPSFNRFQNSFSHIFAGGYAAGYYSYKWAELLSSDA